MAKLFQKISMDLQKAMKEKNTFRLEVLRMMKSKILLVNARGDLPDPEVTKILQKYAKSLKDAVEETKKANKPDAVKKLENEIKIVEEYVPKMMSEEETKKLVAEVIAEVGASSPKDLGKIMKGIMAKGANVDGKIANKIARDLLTPKS